MAAGRRIYAALELLDRQLVDREGRPCGKVDDVELSPSDETGQLYVTAILAGPGVLASRFGRKAFGSWMERVISGLAPSRQPDPVRIPFGLVTDINNQVRVAVDHEDLATFATERWARDHVIEQFPGSHHHAPE